VQTAKPGFTDLTTIIICMSSNLMNSLINVIQEDASDKGKVGIQHQEIAGHDNTHDDCSVQATHLGCRITRDYPVLNPWALINC